MADTAIIGPLRARLVELLETRPELAGVQVEKLWPGDLQADECVWFSRNESTVTVATMKAGRKHRNEEASLSFSMVTHRASMDEAEERVVQMLAALEDVCANSPTLILDGYALDGLVSIRLTSYETEAFPHPERGALAVCEGQLAYRTRLT